MSIKEILINMIPGFMVRIFAASYVAGKGKKLAIEKASHLSTERGICSTIDMLGESVESKEDARACVRSYKIICHDIYDAGLCKQVSISLKPSAMGLNIDPDLCLYNIETVVMYARSMGVNVTIDMEDSTTVNDTLSIYRKLREKYDNVGTVLQTRLKRTGDDIEKHIMPGDRVRICIGAYTEPPEVATPSKEFGKIAMFDMGMELLRKGVYVEFATHDEAVLDKVLANASDNDIPLDRLEFQWLLGVPVDHLVKRYQEKGVKVRYYVPYCDRWDSAIKYLKRRMIESPGMSMFFYVIKNLLTRIKESIHE